MYLEGPHNLEPRGDKPREWDTDDEPIEIEPDLPDPLDGLDLLYTPEDWAW